MFMPHPKSYVEILMPDEVVLKGGAFSRGLHHEGGTFMNGHNAL